MRREEALLMLPDVYQRTAVAEDNPLTVLLGVMEELHARDEAILAGLERYFDPRASARRFRSLSELVGGSRLAVPRST